MTNFLVPVLRNSQKSKKKKIINASLKHILCIVSKLCEKVNVDERNTIMERLESKQKECQLLCEIHNIVTPSMHNNMKHQQQLYKRETWLTTSC